MPQPKERPLVITLDSSAIRQIVYDPRSEELEVTFTSDHTCTYAPVPPAVVAGLVRAKSAGRYFHRHIKHLSHHAAA